MFCKKIAETLAAEQSFSRKPRVASQYINDKSLLAIDRVRFIDIKLTLKDLTVEMHAELIKLHKKLS